MCTRGRSWQKMEAVNHSFGAEIREALFHLDSKASFTNHGSFGTVPRPVKQVHSDLLDRVETHPDSWFRRQVRPLYLAGCDAAAAFIGASTDEVVLVDNATTAVNTVLRSVVRGPSDGVLVTSFSYAACSIAARAVCEATGAKLHVLEINIPIQGKQQIIDLYRDYLEKHPGITFALVDHITSPSAVVMPVKELAGVCRERGVKVMIDGAHSPGQIPLSLSEMGVDYFTGNLHKWTFCSRGCAALYVRSGLEESIFPLVASHFHYSTYRERFYMQATRDMVSFCVAPTAIDFFEKIGGMTAITAYNTALISWATDMLCDRLSLTPLPIPPDMRAPFMAVMLLPPCLGPATPENELALMTRLFTEYNVQTAIVCVDKHLCLRISAQVYNVHEDFEKLAEALEHEIKQSTLDSNDKI